MTKKANEMLAKLKRLAATEKLTSDDRQQVETLYEAVLAKRFTRTGCPDCYRDACLEAIAWLKKYGDVKKPLRYELHYGEWFRLGGFGSSELYTRATMRDEDAVAYLAETDGKGADKFRTLPKDWKKDVEAYRKKKAESAPSKTERTVAGDAGEDGLDGENK